MRNSKIHINFFIKKYRKCLFSLSFLILIFFFHGCVSLPDPDLDKYEIINLVLTDQLKSENTSFVLKNADTMKFKKLVTDKYTRPKLVLDTAHQFYKFIICGRSNSELKLNNYFDNKDLKYLKESLNKEKSVELDRSKIIRNDILIDYSSFLPIDSSSNTCNTSFNVWDKFHESEYNYSSISEPLINTSKDKAIIGMTVCVTDYLLTKVFSLSKNKEGVWDISSRMTFIDKFVEKSIGEYDPKTKEYLEKTTYTIYVGTLYEKKTCTQQTL